MKIAQAVAAFPPHMPEIGNTCHHYAIELVKIGHNLTIDTVKLSDETLNDNLAYYIRTIIIVLFDKEVAAG